MINERLPIEVRDRRHFEADRRRWERVEQLLQRQVPLARKETGSAGFVGESGTPIGDAAQVEPGWCVAEL